MDLRGNTVLVTGGATGIGLALAERFLRAGSDVVVCGRREDRLRDAQAAHPGLKDHRCDVSTEAGRLDLLAWTLREVPQVNVLVNNAGIQRRLQLTAPEPWSQTHEELAINLEAPIHLSRLFLPHLLKQQRPAIVNVTSGLAFVPLADTPVYCATKAALHSFTQSLRHQLAATPVAVVEVIPPAVDTDLGGPGLHTFGVNVDEFADAVFAGLERGELEVAYGFAEQARRASPSEQAEMFTQMNQRRGERVRPRS